MIKNRNEEKFWHYPSGGTTLHLLRANENEVPPRRQEYVVWAFRVGRDRQPPFRLTCSSRRYSFIPRAVSGNWGESVFMRGAP